jgi:hypothetical protein
MVIDNETYKLTEDNYIQIECIKTQIVLGQTFNHDMKHVVGWKHRNNGKTKRTAAFTIDAAGLVYNHFDSKYLSRFFGDLEQDTRSIVILLENDGWVTKNDKNEFITWVGDIYRNQDEVVEKKWRGHQHWVPFTQEQFDSAIKLINLLCEEYYIPKTVMSHNTKTDLVGYNGVVYKSNIQKHYTDLNPTWKFGEFKNKLEENN